MTMNAEPDTQEEIPQRLIDLREELTEVRTAIRQAYRAASLSVAGRSISRQQLTILKEREAELTWNIQECLRNGSFGRTVFRNRFISYGYGYGYGPA